MITIAYLKHHSECIPALAKIWHEVLGFKNLYLFAFDPTIPEYYSRLGWRTIGMDEFKGHPVTVMGIML